MKRIIVLSFALVALIACGGNDSKENKEEKKGSELSDNPDYQKGLALIGNSDCGTCHKVDEAVTGPTFREIANRYSSGSDSVINYLSDKIISGGSGVWGQTPMVPHAISKDDAKAIVKYILLLKK
jgi:cytochrome c